MKRLLSCLLLMALALSLTACGDWEEPQSDLYQTLADYYGADKTEDEPPVLTSFALPYLSGETAHRLGQQDPECVGFPVLQYVLHIITCP